MSLLGRLAALALLLAGCHHAVVAGGPPLSAGDVDEPARLARVIRSHVDDIRACFERRLAARSIDGTIVIRLSVQADGQLDQVKIVRSDVQDPPLEQCIADYALTWKFPPPGGDRVIVVDYPFHFRALPPAPAAR